MRKILALLLTASMAAPAVAAPRCFTPQEIEADQAVRFQTELMVLSDTCRTPSYTDFSRRNRTTIVTYQHELIEFFRRSGERHAEDALDRYMTHLANEVSLHDGREPVETLCRTSAEFLDRGRRLNGDDYHAIAANRAAEHRDLYRACKR